MATEKARPKRSGSAAARFARSWRAQTGEQVLTSTRRATNSSAANQARQHNPAAAPGIAHHPKDHHGRGTRSALRTGRTNTIAYVCLDAANPFLTDVTRGIEAAMEATSAAVFLCNSDENTARESRYLDMLEQQRVRGILITPIDPTSDRLRALPRRGTPVVVVDRVVPSNELCSVSVDDMLGGELGVAHLIANGHERIGFVGGPMLLGQMIDRLAGARRALSIAAKNPDGIIMIETDAPTIKDGREAGACIAGMPPAQRPTAVLCANDLLALGLLTEALQLGLNVPDDLAIVGYDDIEFTAAAAVPLTSVRQPRHQLGLSAGQLLLEELAGEEHVHQQIELSPELVVRASTTVKPPAGSSPATRAT